MRVAPWHHLPIVVFVIAAIWPAVALAAPGDGAPVDGIKCEQMEGTAFHIHQHLLILNRGKPVLVPSDVGRPLFTPCFYWLHTHTPDGIIHVEAPMVASFTLGQFFDIWGQPLSRTNVAGAEPPPGGAVRVWIDDQPYTGDPRKIELTAHEEITIEVGPPFTKPAPFNGWNGL